MQKDVTLSLLAACALGTASSAQSFEFDYNKDCVIDFLDYLDFANDYGSEYAAADLNLDGVVDTADEDLFFGVETALDFTIYWSVTNNFQVQCDPQRFPVAHNMDTQVDLSGLEISRAAGFLYEQDFYSFPIVYGARAGLYLMLADRVCCPEDFVYTDWLDNWETALANIAGEMPYRLAAMLDITVPELAYVEGTKITFDNETVMATWTETLSRETVPQDPWRGNQASRWTNAVWEINTPTWDTTFITMIDYLPPSGITGAGGLNQTQFSALVRQAYNYFGVAYFTHIVESARFYAPGAEYAFWGYPHSAYPETTSGPGSSQDINDQLANLWPVVDFLAPAVYDYKASDPPTPTSPCVYTDTLADGSLYYKTAIDEARRVRSTYAASAPILPFLSFGYLIYNPSSCSGSIFLYPNDVLQQLVLLKNNGADGGIIWDAIECSEPDAVDDLSDIMQNEWGPIINDISCGTPLP